MTREERWETGSGGGFGSSFHSRLPTAPLPRGLPCGWRAVSNLEVRLHWELCVTAFQAHLVHLLHLLVPPSRNDSPRTLTLLLSPFCNTTSQNCFPGSKQISLGWLGGQGIVRHVPIRRRQETSFSRRRMSGAPDLRSIIRNPVSVSSRGDRTQHTQHTQARSCGSEPSPHSPLPGLGVATLPTASPWPIQGVVVVHGDASGIYMARASRQAPLLDCKE